jgi:hypothetical protein
MLDPAQDWRKIVGKNVRIRQERGMTQEKLSLKPK